MANDFVQAQGGRWSLDIVDVDADDRQVIMTLTAPFSNGVKSSLVTISSDPLDVATVDVASKTAAITAAALTAANA